jgi:hypothetical protein
MKDAHRAAPNEKRSPGLRSSEDGSVARYSSSPIIDWW